MEPGGTTEAAKDLVKDEETAKVKPAEVSTSSDTSHDIPKEENLNSLETTQSCHEGNIKLEGSGVPSEAVDAQGDPVQSLPIGAADSHMEQTKVVAPQEPVEMPQEAKLVEVSLERPGTAEARVAEESTDGDAEPPNRTESPAKLPEQIVEKSGSQTEEPIVETEQPSLPAAGSVVLAEGSVVAPAEVVEEPVKHPEGEMVSEAPRPATAAGALSMVKTEEIVLTRHEGPELVENATLEEPAEEIDMMDEPTGNEEEVPKEEVKEPEMKQRRINRREAICPFLLKMYVTSKMDTEKKENEEPEEVQIYAWEDCTLKEIVCLLKDVVPETKDPLCKVTFTIESLGTKKTQLLGTMPSSFPSPLERRTLQSFSFHIGDTIHVTLEKRQKNEEKEIPPQKTAARNSNPTNTERPLVVRWRE